MTSPNYSSDYQHSYVNGSLEHPFGLPGLACNTCGETWSGVRVLPFACPKALQGEKNLRVRYPISEDQHRDLRLRLAEELAKQGYAAGDLKPGDDLQPSYLDIPSRPRADFLWSGLGSVVVSDRVKDQFEKNKVPGVAFCPVMLRKVGSREAGIAVPLPESGEPEDLLQEAALLKSTEAVGPYFEMIVLMESGLPPGVVMEQICPACGREAVKMDHRTLSVLPEMAPSSPIFLLATTLMVIVNDDFKRLLEEHRFTNVAFEPGDHCE